MSTHQMLINYAPGEACRVAVVCDKRLEDLHTERTNTANHVGNIYVGRVVNVEAGIQAAFVDFGLEHNGFLHISDLHPQYFTGDAEEATESVGHKTPRRDRPPIQRALKRGQEILVQVIKEGIGTKGPTLTSYLSIPGRYLVMMPAMDRVGVSRKIEDDELRRKMRDQLDQLDLPAGFGFILRTAGMDRGKTELKRDLAYLNRLWRDIDRRRKTGSCPRLLYAESDLLLRALRDMLTPEIDEIIIDDESALRRASQFLKIFAPRSAPRLLHYDSPVPIYHAFGVEKQIQSMHLRRVDLPSGGYLVIDETEALVAIDVNSGKMRSAGDAETTAYRTDLEAVDEIARQLRLRDLGGLVILDLIDMRSRAHRREIEQRFRANLKKDPARSRALSISQFGLIELTRQRVQGSMRSVHFTSCPECDGRGFVQRPDSLASDAMRNLSVLLQHERVRKVELVIAPRVASELLSFKRRKITRLEIETGKEIAVRVSETVPVDSVRFYAYDDRGADVDVASLPALKPTREFEEWAAPASTTAELLEDPATDARRLERELASQLRQRDHDEADQAEPHMLETAGELESPDDAPAPKRKRRRRRRGNKTTTRSVEAPADAIDQQPAPVPTCADDSGAPEQLDKPSRSRRRRRGRSKAPASDQQAPSSSDQDAVEPTAEPDGAPISTPESQLQTTSQKKRRRRRRGRSVHTAQNTGDQTPIENERESEPAHAPATSRFAPRGDSWDIEPEAIPSRSAPEKKQPKPSRAASDGADDHDIEAKDSSDAVAKSSSAESPDRAAKKKTRRKKATAKKSVRKKKVAATIKKKSVAASKRKSPSTRRKPVAVEADAASEE